MITVTAEKGAVPRAEEPPDTGARHKLTAVTGLAALSLDAMASAAYGPEAVVLVLAAAGGGYALGFTLPVTLARGATSPPDRSSAPSTSRPTGSTRCPRTTPPP